MGDTGGTAVYMSVGHWEMGLPAQGHLTVYPFILMGDITTYLIMHI